MLRSIDALGKDKCPARSDRWARLCYSVLELLGSSGLDDRLGGWVNDGDIRTCTVRRVSFSPAIFTNRGMISFDVPNLSLNAPRHVQRRLA